MAPPAASPPAGNSNDHDGSAHIQPVHEPIDVANTSASIPAQPPTSPTVDVTESTIEAPVPTGTAAVQPKAKRTRAKVGMSNKHLLGSEELFVDSKFAIGRTGPDEPMLEGKVVKCPNEKTNGSCCKIDWLVVDPGCLRHWCHKDAMTKPLREAMSLCDEKHGGQPTKSKKAKPSGTAIVSRGDKSRKSNPATPPETQQWRAQNGMRTAASASVSVSSVGGSMCGPTTSMLSHSRSHGSDEEMPGLMPPPPRRTRRTAMTDPAQTVESESDDGDSVNEHNNAHTFECDRDQNDLGGNKSSGDKEERVEPAIDQPSGPQKRMWEGLKELKWDFQWVEANDATAVDHDCYPFNKEPSPKEGVASSFADLFKTFYRVGGLSHEQRTPMIAVTPKSSRNWAKTSSTMCHGRTSPQRNCSGSLACC